MSTASIRARLDATTPGPWSVQRMESGYNGQTVSEYGINPIAAIGWWADSADAHQACSPLEEADAIFVARSREDIAALLEVVEAVRAWRNDPDYAPAHMLEVISALDELESLE